MDTRLLLGLKFTYQVNEELINVIGIKLRSNSLRLGRSIKYFNTGIEVYLPGIDKRGINNVIVVFEYPKPLGE